MAIVSWGFHGRRPADGHKLPPASTRPPTPRYSRQDRHCGCHGMSGPSPSPRRPGRSAPGTGHSSPRYPARPTVQRVEDGEVSPYLADDMVPGGFVEVRDQVGGWFV